MKSWLSIKIISFFSFSIFLYCEVPKNFFASFLFLNSFPVGLCSIIYRSVKNGLCPMDISILCISILSLRICHLKNENLPLYINLSLLVLEVRNKLCTPSSLSVFLF